MSCSGPGARTGGDRETCRYCPGSKALVPHVYGCRAWARHATVQKDAEPRERKLVQAHGLITRELGVRIVSAFGVRMTGEYLRN